MKNNILCIVGILSLFLISAHLLDVGDIIGDSEKSLENIINRENLNNKYEVNYGAGNGFWTIDARKLYHTGFYLMYLAFFILLIAYIDLLVKNK